MPRAIHVIDDPALEDAPAFYARGTWPGRTATAIRRVDPDVGLECCFMDPDLREARAFTQDGVAFRVFPAHRGRGGLPWSPQMMAHLARAARERAILHVHGYPNRLFRAVTRLGAPVVAQDHGRNPHNYRPRGLLHAPYQRARRWLDERPLRRVDQFYYLTPGEGERLARHVGPERVRFQTMGLDVARFQPGDAAAARRRLGLPEEGRWLLFIGNDFARKGADVAIGALPRLDDDVRLALVGRCAPDVRLALDAQVAALGLEGRVRFLGLLEDALLPEAYRAVDLLVLPTRWEGTLVTVSVMEALATNVPVVTSPAGATAEKLGGFGVVVDAPAPTPEAFADAIRDALARPFGASRAYAAATFGWDAIAEATARDYRRIWKARYGE